MLDDDIFGKNVLPLLNEITLTEHDLGEIVISLAVLCVSLGGATYCVAGVGILGTWFGRKWLLCLVSIHYQSPILGFFVLFTTVASAW